MSSRVIPSGDSEKAKAIIWRKLACGGSIAGASASPMAGADIVSVDAESLRQRISQMAAETETRERQARQQGYQEGESAAAQKAAKQVQQAIDGVARSVEEMLALRLRMRQQMEEDLVRLAVAVARRVLHRELTVDPDALLGIVKSALQKIESRELHRIRVAPADARLLEKSLAALNLPARVEVVSDSAMTRGSVIFETGRGSLDASVETQLQEIESGFTDLVRRQPK